MSSREVSNLQLSMSREESNIFQRSVMGRSGERSRKKMQKGKATLPKKEDPAFMRRQARAKKQAREQELRQAVYESVRPVEREKRHGAVISSDSEEEEMVERAVVELMEGDQCFQSGDTEPSAESHEDSNSNDGDEEEEEDGAGDGDDGADGCDEEDGDGGDGDGDDNEDGDGDGDGWRWW